MRLETGSTRRTAHALYRSGGYGRARPLGEYRLIR